MKYPKFWLAKCFLRNERRMSDWSIKVLIDSVVDTYYDQN
jgi:hypothetical protein